MTPLDAAHATVHDYPGGSESLAPRLGMGGSILRNKVNANNNTNHLTLVDADKMMSVTGDHRILEALAQQHGYVLVPVAFDTPASDSAILELVTKVWRHNGNVGKAVDDAFADGRITKRELSAIEKTIYDLDSTLHAMLARISQIAE